MGGGDGVSVGIDAQHIPQAGRVITHRRCAPIGQSTRVCSKSATADRLHLNPIGRELVIATHIIHRRMRLRSNPSTLRFVRECVRAGYAQAQRQFVRSAKTRLDPQA
jgi:hypothetical protein